MGRQEFKINITSTCGHAAVFLSLFLFHCYFIAAPFVGLGAAAAAGGEVRVVRLLVSRCPAGAAADLVPSLGLLCPLGGRASSARMQLARKSEEKRRCDKRAKKGKLNKACLRPPLALARDEMRWMRLGEGAGTGSPRGEGGRWHCLLRPIPDGRRRRPLSHRRMPPREMICLRCRRGDERASQSCPQRRRSSCCSQRCGGF